MDKDTKTTIKYKRAMAKAIKQAKEVLREIRKENVVVRSIK